MDIGIAASYGVSWLWEKYGEKIVNEFFSFFMTEARISIKNRWKVFHWQDAEGKYRMHLRELHSTTRLLGNPKPILIQNIFTEVYVLEKLTALQRYSLQELRDLIAKGLRYQSQKRQPILPLLEADKRFFILGKPGAGKTTLLKYITLQACLGKFSKTPIFISIKEWSDSQKSLLEFMTHQFDICSFPEAENFIEVLLRSGSAIVLFDGLDEVREEYGHRSKIIREITEFSDKYQASSICITCRLAATDFTFSRFTYLEIADFNEEQIYGFVSKWHELRPLQHQKFLEEIKKPENQGFLELSKTPLLLTLLCLAFDDTGYFPTRRVDLYKEALDALLKRWDASRDIQRDSVYRSLSPIRKEQMLARIAAENFEKGEYFVNAITLSNQITNYLQQLPQNKIHDTPDGEAILLSVEAQHGILIKQAYGIYSFLHLTLQEYLTARFIVDNAADGTLERLINQHVDDLRWKEVFINTASILDDANKFCELIQDGSEKMIKGDINCAKIIEWANDKLRSTKWSNKPSARAIFIFLALLANSSKAESLARVFSEAIAKFSSRNDSSTHLSLASSQLHNISLADALNLARSRALEIVRELDPKDASILEQSSAFYRDVIVDTANLFGISVTQDEINNLPALDDNQANLMKKYLEQCHLLMEIISVAALSDRPRTESKLLKFNLSI